MRRAVLLVALVGCAGPKEAETGETAECPGARQLPEGMASPLGGWSGSWAQDYYDDTCSVAGIDRDSEAWIGSFTLDGSAGALAVGAHDGAMTPEGRKALYMALEKMPEATHLLAPRVTVEASGITMLKSTHPIFGKRCATVEARGVKIGDRPTANQ